MMWKIAIITCIVGLMTSAVATPKKGTAFTMKNPTCNDTQTLSDISWWYSWGTQDNKLHEMGCPARGEFVPMFWGGGHIDNVNLPSSSRHVLGFNEPNERHQSHMTPQAAAIHWRQLESVAKGKSLISPAPARCKVHGNNSNCLMETFEWLDEFFKECSGCKVDYVAVHSYTCGADNDLRFLETVHNRYKKQVWLTEFACPYTTSLTHVENYMKRIIPRLERAPFVVRYAWFGNRVIHDGSFIHKVNALHEDSSSKLTALGRLYNSLH
ncbi:alkali-sensitive linkage protein 1-like [Haliotis rubra]|uniref:alkali-sensitive linkage protein 1-like n=1 Tax=Haliotis rubra TaxID=36100 RepID=UPI001EE4EF32|nr:alkali-sensitive linkage protein 1-like [Haliotis rubra]